MWKLRSAFFKVEKKSERKKSIRKSAHSRHTHTAYRYTPQDKTFVNLTLSSNLKKSDGTHVYAVIFYFANKMCYCQWTDKKVSKQKKKRRDATIEERLRCFTCHMLLFFPFRYVHHQLLWQSFLLWHSLFTIWFSNWNVLFSQKSVLILLFVYTCQVRKGKILLIQIETFFCVFFFLFCFFHLKSVDNFTSILWRTRAYGCFWSFYEWFSSQNNEFEGNRHRKGNRILIIIH